MSHMAYFTAKVHLTNREFTKNLFFTSTEICRKLSAPLKHLDCVCALVQKMTVLGMTITRSLIY